MQTVILAGGLGTRLRPITETIPKVMVPVCGRPFMEYQLNFLARSGVTDVVVCLGYMGHAVEEHFGDGRGFGVSLRYGYDGDKQLGTAGAIKNVEKMLDDTFFVLYGDSYAIVDLQGAMDYFRKHNSLGLMVVFRNEDRWDRSNVIVEDNFVRVYDKQRKLPGMVYIDFGVAAFRRGVFSHVPPGISTDLSVIYNALIERQELLAFETVDRFYEIGSPEGLREFESLIRSGAVPIYSQAQ